MDADRQPVLIERNDVASLLEALRRDGYLVVGPTVRDGAIAYDELRSDADLPAGWTDEQEAGRYRLVHAGNGALFDHVVGPHSWKRWLFAPHARQCRVELTREGWAIEPEAADPTRHAFVGVRACELAAIAVQDRVFLEQEHVDPLYRARREGAFILAVSCTRAGGTCFCASMGTGPQVTDGHDLALTELLDGERHEFVVDVGSPRGESILRHVPHRPATAAEVDGARARVAEAARHMGRAIDADGLRDVLLERLNHPRWHAVADRCLACANCTMVCPTCFCHTVRDTTDLAGGRAERWRDWDSCFSQEFSYLHGGSVRVSIRSRYRQWLTHKLASWFDQFGTSGCVGCGRCITWCPVGIDLTEEARAVRGVAAS